MSREELTLIVSPQQKGAKAFLDAGKNGLTRDTQHNATAPEVRHLKEENEALKQAVAEMVLENQRLKNSLGMIPRGGRQSCSSLLREVLKPILILSGSESRIGPLRDGTNPQSTQGPRKTARPECQLGIEWFFNYGINRRPLACSRRFSCCPRVNLSLEAVTAWEE